MKPWRKDALKAPVRPDWDVAQRNMPVCGDGRIRACAFHIDAKCGKEGKIILRCFTYRFWTFNRIAHCFKVLFSVLMFRFA